MTDSLTPSRMTDEQIREIEDACAYSSAPERFIAFARCIESAVLAAAGERAPLQGAEAGRAVAQRMLANPGMRSILQNLKDGAAGERADAETLLRDLIQAHREWDDAGENDHRLAELSKAFDDALERAAAHVAGERVDAPAEPDAEAAIAAGFKSHGYRQGTKECVAFYRGACWQLAQSASPADAPQPAKAADPRFFMDHDMWHDRQTGQHLFTQDQYDAGRREAVEQYKERKREEALLAARRQAAANHHEGRARIGNVPLMGAAPADSDAERAEWLADKIVAGGDYAKEAAAMLRRWPAEPAPAVALDGAEVLRCVLRCRYPVATSISPSGYGWDTPRLDEVIADLATEAPEAMGSEPALLEACRKAEEWLSGWASAEPYLSVIRAAIANATEPQPAKAAEPRCDGCGKPRREPGLCYHCRKTLADCRAKAACPAPVEPEKHPQFYTWTWDVQLGAGHWKAEYGWKKPKGTVHNLQPLYTAAPTKAADSVTAAPALICPRCKVDRFKESCPGPHSACPMKADAHGEPAPVAASPSSGGQQ